MIGDTCCSWLLPIVSCHPPYLTFHLLIYITVVMILRVHAMWNRSKTILAILLFIYVLQIIVSIVWEGISEGTLSGMFLTLNTVLAILFSFRAFLQ